MDLVTLLEEVQAIARTGLAFSRDVYDRERYERLLELSCEKYGELLDMPSTEVKTRLSGELGYITPKIGTEAAVFNDSGEILLMERPDGTGWCMPCGWVEPNEKPADGAVRETREETGLEVKVRRFVGVFSRHAGVGDNIHSQIAVVHLCDVVGGELTLSHEGLDLRYWPLNDVPSWHGHHERMARMAYKMWAAEDTEAISD